MTMTEPMLTISPAVEVPASHVQAVRALIDRINDSGLMDALQQFYEKELPVYGEIDASAVIDQFFEVTGWDELLSLALNLIGALGAATEADAYAVQYPEWASDAAERAERLERHVSESTRRENTEAFERAFRAGHALGAKGEPLPERLSIDG